MKLYENYTTKWNCYFPVKCQILATFLHYQLTFEWKLSHSFQIRSQFSFSEFCKQIKVTWKRLEVLKFEGLFLLNPKLVYFTILFNVPILNKVARASEWRIFNCFFLVLQSKLNFTSGFRSLWTTPCLCMKSMTEASFLMYLDVSSSVNRFLVLIRWRSSPPRRYSVTM